MIDLWDKCIEAFTEQGVNKSLAIFFIITIILIVVMAIIALIMKIIVLIKYSKGNNKTTKAGKNSFEVAQEMLNQCDLQDIKIKKAGFLRAAFFGNSYSLSKKAIYLRRGIAEKDSITAVGLALQKVGIAQLCESGNKMARTRNQMQVLNIFSPILFVPSVLIGVLMDVLIFNALGMFSIVGIVIGVFFIFTGLISTLLTLPVEKKANNLALKMIDETGILTQEEREIVKKIFSAYIISYVCEFIIAILRLIQLILEIIINIQSSNNKK